MGPVVCDWVIHESYRDADGTGWLAWAREQADRERLSLTAAWGWSDALGGAAGVECSGGVANQIDQDAFDVFLSGRDHYRRGRAEAEFDLPAAGDAMQQPGAALGNLAQADGPGQPDRRIGGVRT
jgi:hypothetical protein